MQFPQCNGYSSLINHAVIIFVTMAFSQARYTCAEWFHTGDCFLVQPSGTRIDF